jgi:hypothetical protein
MWSQDALSLAPINNGFKRPSAMCQHGLQVNGRIRSDRLESHGKIPRRISSGELHSAPDGFLTRLF